MEQIQIGKHNIKASWFIIVLFLVSVIIRIPNLDRPLSKHHEFNTALVLIPVEIWNNTSPMDYNFSPVMSYQNEKDLYINNMTLDYMEKDGSYYYLSFPVLTYLVPYVAFKMGLPATPLGLQILNMLTHLLCVFLLFKITFFITSERLSERSSAIAAIVSSSVYLFSPTPLWFHGNGYTHHTLIIVFILWGIYTALKLFHSKAQIKILTIISLFFALTFAILTAWIGCILALIIFCIATYKSLKNIRFSLIVGVTILAVIISLGFTFWQYSSVVGVDNFLLYLENRFFVRTTMDGGNSGILQTLVGVGKWYIVGYLSILVFLLFQLLNVRPIKFNLTHKEKSFFWMTFILVFSHHFLLGEFTIAHNYSVLIDGVLISILVGVLFGTIVESKINVTRNYIGIAVALILCVGQYYYINRPGEISQNGDKYSAFKEIGETIKNNSTKNDLLFTLNLNEKPAPQVIYYAKRNFYQVDHLTEVYLLLEERGEKSGKVFIIENMKVKRIEIVSLN